MNFRYKMAEHFGDSETMAKILDAPSTIKAEEAMKDIKDFDEAKWNEVSWNLSSFLVRSYYNIRLQINFCENISEFMV